MNNCYMSLFHPFTKTDWLLYSLTVIGSGILNVYWWKDKTVCRGKNGFHQKGDAERSDCRRVVGKFRGLRAIPELHRLLSSPGSHWCVNPAPASWFSALFWHRWSGLFYWWHTVIRRHYRSLLPRYSGGLPRHLLLHSIPPIPQRWLPAMARYRSSAGVCSLAVWSCCPFMPDKGQTLSLTAVWFWRFFIWWSLVRPWHLVCTWKEHN